MTTICTDTDGQQPGTAPAEPARDVSRRWPLYVGLALALLASSALGALAAHLATGKPVAASSLEVRKKASLAERAPELDPSVPPERHEDYRAAMAAIAAHHQQWLALYASGASPTAASAAFPATTARFAAEEAKRYAYFHGVGHTLLPGGTWTIHSGRWAEQGTTGLVLEVCDSRMLTIRDDELGQFRREEPRAPWRYHLQEQEGTWVLSSAEFLTGTC